MHSTNNILNKSSVATVLAGGAAAPALPWYRADGGAAANVKRVYQPYGAASYAASKVNLANPGTGDAVAIGGVAEPDWGGAVGWTFPFNTGAGAGLNSLLQIPAAAHDWTCLIRYANLDLSLARVPAGCQSGGGDTGGCFWYLDGTDKYAINNGTSAIAGAAPAAGVLCIAGNKAYLDGVDLGVTIGAGNDNYQADNYIGRSNSSNAFVFRGDILAIVWYDITKTPTEVASLTAAMNALPFDLVRQGYVGLGRGALIDWGMPTFGANEIAPADQDPDVFAPTGLDIDQWLDAVVSAGMKYAVCVTKHQDGFAMWPTAYAAPSHDPYSIAQTTWYAENGNPDVVGLFVAGCRSRGLKPCLYFGIQDDTYETRSGTDETTDAAAYIAMITTQLTELLTNYGDITAIWTDSWGWQMGYSNIPYHTINEIIKGLQPDCILIENSHTHPTVTSEIEQYETRSGGDGHIPEGNTRLSEETDSVRVDGKWFYHPTQTVADADYIVAATIKAAIANANNNSGAYLLGITPTTAGVLPAAMVTRLGQLGA